jgi:mono/diheme cytochrome c family protein
MKRFKKIMKWTGIILLVIIAGLLILTYSRQNRKFDAPFPAIHASTDSTIIKRGEYLVYGPAHCSFCHATKDEIEEMKKGKTLPLAGGFEFNLGALGKIWTRNLTPDPETGLGKISDEAIARTLRYGVGSDGRAILDFMPFHDASDEDLTAIISYLRSMKPVKREIPKTQYKLLGKAINAFLLEPVGPTETPPVSVKPDSTAVYGKYLVSSIGNCRGCHTPRNPLTGAYAGPDFSGGVEIDSEVNPGEKFITPNLTPDKETGWIKGWTEQMFIERFRKGRNYSGTPMPWESFNKMSDNDLKAIYRYLATVKPINHKIERVRVAEGGK